MKIGIVQNKIIYGGRLKVIIDIVRILNKRGVIPDLITYSTNISPEYIKMNYNAEAAFRLRILKSPLSRLPGELNIISFGISLFGIINEYDYLIDSNNTSLFMPSCIPILSYVHFPRAARYKSQKYLHQSKYKEPIIFSVLYFIYLKLISFLYQIHFISSKNHLIANSFFTRDKILSSYPRYKNYIPIVYPPASNLFSSPASSERVQNKNKSVSILGRFCKEKDQLSLIRLAACLSDWDFHFIGFSDHQDEYLKTCVKFVDSRKLKNVFFHANASYTEKASILSKSRFFLHANINEPFGISTVESILYGCLPLVHNSGGQKEIVPINELRFDSIADLPDKIKFLELKTNQLPIYQKLLFKFVKKQFSRIRFQQLMTKIIDDFETSLTSK